jgi:ribosomal protein S27AE
VSEAPTVRCGGDDEFDGATFVRTCPKCGRFVAPGTVTLDGRGQPVGTNAKCSRCGPVAMPFIGYLALLLLALSGCATAPPKEVMPNGPRHSSEPGPRPHAVTWAAHTTNAEPLRVTFRLPDRLARPGCGTDTAQARSWMRAEVAVQRRASDWTRPTFAPVVIATSAQEYPPGATCTLAVSPQAPGDVLLVRARNAAGVGCWGPSVVNGWRTE